MTVGQILQQIIGNPQALAKGHQIIKNYLADHSFLLQLIPTVFCPLAPKNYFALVKEVFISNWHQFDPATKNEIRAQLIQISIITDKPEQLGQLMRKLFLQDGVAIEWSSITKVIQKLQGNPRVLKLLIHFFKDADSRLSIFARPVLSFLVKSTALLDEHLDLCYQVLRAVCPLQQVDPINFRKCMEGLQLGLVAIIDRTFGSVKSVKCLSVMLSEAPETFMGHANQLAVKIIQLGNQNLEKWMDNLDNFSTQFDHTDLLQLNESQSLSNLIVNLIQLYDNVWTNNKNKSGVSIVGPLLINQVCCFICLTSQRKQQAAQDCHLFFAVEQDSNSGTLRNRGLRLIQSLVDNQEGLIDYIILLIDSLILWKPMERATPELQSQFKKSTVRKEQYRQALCEVAVLLARKFYQQISSRLNHQDMTGLINLIVKLIQTQKDNHFIVAQCLQALANYLHSYDKLFLRQFNFTLLTLVNQSQSVLLRLVAASCLGRTLRGLPQEPLLVFENPAIKICQLLGNSQENQLQIHQALMTISKFSCFYRQSVIKYYPFEIILPLLCQSGSLQSSLQQLLKVLLSDKEQLLDAMSGPLTNHISHPEVIQVVNILKPSPNDQLLKIMLASSIKQEQMFQQCAKYFQFCLRDHFGVIKSHLPQLVQLCKERELVAGLALSLLCSPAAAAIDSMVLQDLLISPLIKMSESCLIPETEEVSMLFCMLLKLNKEKTLQKVSFYLQGIVCQWLKHFKGFSKSGQKVGLVFLNLIYTQTHLKDKPFVLKALKSAVQDVGESQYLLGIQEDLDEMEQYQGLEEMTGSQSQQSRWQFYFKQLMEVDLHHLKDLILRL